MILKKWCIENNRQRLINEWIEEKYGDMNDYTHGCHKKINWKCEKCGEIFEAKISNRISENSGCPYCSGRKVKNNGSNSLYNFVITNKKYNHLIKEWLEESGDMKKYLPHIRKKVNWKCSKCEYIFSASINDRTRKEPRDCPYCSNNKIKPDGSNSLYNYCVKNVKYKYLIEEWLEENGDMKHYLSHSNKKINWKCRKCGLIYLAMINNRTHRDPRNCPYCSNKKVRPDGSNSLYNYCIENIKYKCLIEEWNDKTSMKKYLPHSNKKVNWKCRKCGCVFFGTICNRTNEDPTGCPKCQESHGEKCIREYLEEKDIKFETQWKIIDMDKKHSLRADFYLSDCKKIIEYDGKQHFEPIDYFGGENRIKSTHNYDFRKNNYAISHDIPIFRISYLTPFSEIPSIIDDILSCNNLPYYFYQKKDEYEEMYQKLEKEDNLSINIKNECGEMIRLFKLKE